MNYIKVYDNVLPRETCNELIEAFEVLKANGSAPSMRHSEYEWEQDYRSFLELNISHQPEFNDFVPAYYERVKEVYAHYEKSCGIKFFPKNHGFEDLRMKKYEANDHDQFGWHVDVGDYASAKRYLVMFLYLNDVEEGGETAFENDLTVKPVCGRMVVFPPMWNYPHIGTKPISGPKYIVSTYLHYV